VKGNTKMYWVYVPEYRIQWQNVVSTEWTFRFHKIWIVIMLDWLVYHRLQLYNRTKYRVVTGYTAMEKRYKLMEDNFKIIQF